MTRSNHVQPFINHKSTLSASAISGIHEKKRGLPLGHSMFQVRILEVSKGEPTIVQTSRMWRTERMASFYHRSILLSTSIHLWNHKKRIEHTPSSQVDSVNSVANRMRSHWLMNFLRNGQSMGMAYPRNTRNPSFRISFLLVKWVLKPCHARAKLGYLGREEDYAEAHLQSDIQCRSIEGYHYSTSTTTLHESHLAMCGFKITKKIEQTNRRKFWSPLLSLHLR